MASLLGFQKEIEERVKDARRSGSSSGKENRLPSDKTSGSISGSGSGSTKEISGSASAYFKESPITSPGSTKHGSGSQSSGDLKERSGSVKEATAFEDSEDSTEAYLQV